MTKARDLADLGNKTSLDEINDAYDAGALSNRNLIINGAMQVAQRGTSATVGPNGTGEGYTVVDRIRNSLNGSFVSTFTQSTDAPSGFGNSAKIEITTADNSLGSTEFWHFRYGFEGQDLQSIGKGTSDAKSFTLSFWVKSNKTGVYTTEFEDNNNARLNSMSYTINSSNVWEYKSLTFNPDTTGAFTNNNNLSLRLNFWLCSGSQYQGGTFYNGTWGGDVDGNRVHGSQVNLGDTVGNTWQITGVQLEVGDTATPFEHRSYGEELAKCQRYFEKQTFSGGYQFVCNSINTATTQVEGFIPFGVEKRASPTVTSSAASTWRVNALSNDATASGINWFTGTPYGVRGQWTRGSGTHTIRDASYVNVEASSPNEAYVNIDAEL